MIHASQEKLTVLIVTTVQDGKDSRLDVYQIGQEVFHALREPLSLCTGKGFSQACSMCEIQY